MPMTCPASWAVARTSTSAWRNERRRSGRRPREPAPVMSGERGPALVVRWPGEVVLEERGAPSPGTGEVLIRPGVVGLCGTDLDIVAGRAGARRGRGWGGAGRARGRRLLGGAPGRAARGAGRGAGRAGAGGGPGPGPAAPGGRAGGGGPRAGGARGGRGRTPGRWPP